MTPVCGSMDNPGGNPTALNVGEPPTSWTVTGRETVAPSKSRRYSSRGKIPSRATAHANERLALPPAPSVAVTATDGAGGSASLSFAWAVARLGIFPLEEYRRDFEGATVSLPVTVQDVGGSPTFSAVGLPPGLSIDPQTGVIQGTLGAPAAPGTSY